MTDCAIVTGAAGALGGAVARALRDGAATRGLELWLVDSPRHLARAEQLAAELGSARAMGANIADAAEWRSLLEAVNAAGGVPVAAALIAGGYRGGAPFWASEESSLDDMMSGNLGTVAASLRAILPGMVERKVGRVVVIGSRAVERPWTGAGSAAYAASKAAVVALAQAVAAECLEHQVTVNAILPSTMDTPANRAAMPEADPTRWVPLAAAAKLVVSLLEPGAGHVTGAAIPIYGRA